MSLGQLTKQPNFSGVTAGASGTASTRITPTGKHYAHYLIAKKAGGVLMTEAEMEASISSIEVQINGSPKHKCSPKKYRDLFYTDCGYECSQGVIPILFYSPKLDNFGDRATTGIGCADVSDFTLIANTIAGAGNVLVTLECYADYNPYITEKIGTYRQIMQLPRTILNTGENEDNTVPTYGEDASLNAIHIYPGTAGVLSYITMKTDDFELVTKAIPAVLATELEMSGRAIIDDVTSLRFDTGRSKGSTLPMRGVKSIRLITSWSTAPTTDTVLLLDFYRGMGVSK